MRWFAASRKSMTMVELMVATAISAVVMLVGWASWEMCLRQTSAAAAATEASRNAFYVLDRIRAEVMRASTIQVPDPDHVDVASMQLFVPLSGSTVRRAFRVQNGALVVDLKDEGVASYTAFQGITSLAFAMQDAPTNAMVQISCTCVVNGRQVQMQTVARKRN